MVDKGEKQGENNYSSLPSWSLVTWENKYCRFSQ